MSIYLHTSLAQDLHTSLSSGRMTTPTQAGLHWPGSKLPISRNNGFTLGYGERPWWVSGEVKAQKPLGPRAKGGFGANNGTIPGMREKA